MNQDHKTTPVEQDQVATPTSQTRNASQGHQEARRRLLKAATVAPIIYTLPSGAALAAASATCISKPENEVTGVSEQTDDEGNLTGNLETSSDTYVFSSGNESQLSIGNEYENGGQIYVYDGDNTLVAESCWASINVAGTASKQAFDRIV